MKKGRSHGTDLKLLDISVSREHADLIFINNKCYLKDLGSKFGTLFLAQKPLEINIGDRLNIQSGRTLMLFNLPKNDRCIGCTPSKKSPAEESQKNRVSEEEISKMVNEANQTPNKKDILKSTEIKENEIGILEREQNPILQAVLDENELS